MAPATSSDRFFFIQGAAGEGPTLCLSPRLEKASATYVAVRCRQPVKTSRTKSDDAPGSPMQTRRGDFCQRSPAKRHTAPLQSSRKTEDVKSETAPRRHTLDSSLQRTLGSRVMPCPRNDQAIKTLEDIDSAVRAVEAAVACKKNMLACNRAKVADKWRQSSRASTTCSSSGGSVELSSWEGSPAPSRSGGSTPQTLHTTRSLAAARMERASQKQQQNQSADGMVSPLIYTPKTSVPSSPQSSHRRSLADARATLKDWVCAEERNQKWCGGINEMLNDLELRSAEYWATH